MTFTPWALRPVSRISATARADRLAAVGDEHDLVAGLDERDADDRAVALARVDEDDALAAAVLRAELLERRALAVAASRRPRARCWRSGSVTRHADDLVVLGELDGLHADRAAAHRAHLLLGEADRLTLLGGDQELARAVGERGREQLIVVLDLHADDALLAEVLVLGDLGLLDLTALA